MSQFVHSLQGSYFNIFIFKYELLSKMLRCKLCLMQVSSTVTTALPPPQGKVIDSVYLLMEL